MMQAGSSLSALIAGIWEPGVSPVTHGVVQVSLGCLLVTLVTMINGGFGAPPLSSSSSSSSSSSRRVVLPLSIVPHLADLSTLDPL